jgi:hypothetical protein
MTIVYVISFETSYIAKNMIDMVFLYVFPVENVIGRMPA